MSKVVALVKHIQQGSDPSVRSDTHNDKLPRLIKKTGYKVATMLKRAKRKKV